MLPVSMALFALLLSQQATTGSIAGVVVDSITNQGIAGAQVTATRIPIPTAAAASAAPGAPVGVATPVIVSGVAGGIVGQSGAGLQIVQPAQLAPVRTEAGGSFEFRNLDPGVYMLRAAADGYAQREYAPQLTGPGSMTAQITLGAGQALTNVALRLIPGGTVSGRVTGSSGEPLVNIEISLFRSAYGPDGRKTFQQGGMAVTNDRGEYRLFWITPGAYYLSAASSNRPMPGLPFNPSLSGNKYPRVFYPAAADPSGATPVDVKPAVELGGLDFRLNEQATYHVRGRVVDSESGAAPPRGVSINIMPRSPILPAGTVSLGSPYNPANGSFDLRDIPSGSYVIRAQMPFPRPPAPGQPFPVPPIAIASVDVSGADVDGVVLTFIPPTSIAGRARIEGETWPETLRTSVYLRPASTGGLAGPAPRPATINPDGSFGIEGVGPGEYEVSVGTPFYGGQGGMYVKELRLGSVDLLGHSLVIDGPVSDAIELVFSKSGAQIAGTVRDSAQQLRPRTEVVLVPDRRERRDLFKFTSTGPNGEFRFNSVAPGSYKVFAWESMEAYGWFAPEVLAQYEGSATPATVNDSSTMTLDLKSIPGTAK